MPPIKTKIKIVEKELLKGRPRFVFSVYLDETQVYMSSALKEIEELALISYSEPIWRFIDYDTQQKAEQYIDNNFRELFNSPKGSIHEI